MKVMPFIQQLKHTIPESSWSWVLAALRQDRVVWESLQSENFYQEALQTIGNNPVEWSPAGLALLAIKRPITLEKLQTSPLQPIDDKLRHMAACAFEELVKGDQEGNMTLSQAGLLALSLRERRRLLGSWEELAENLNAAPYSSWRTPLACLYGMLPDPADLIAVLVDARLAQAVGHGHVLASRLPDSEVLRFAAYDISTPPQAWPH